MTLRGDVNGSGRGVTAAGRRLLGLLLLVASLLPLFRLLDHPGTGVPGRQTVTLAATLLESAWWGGATVLGAGLALAFVLPMNRIRSGLGAAGARLRGVGSWKLALGLGALAGLLAAGASRFVFQGRPSLEDGMALLVHARYLAEGRVAGTLSDPAAAWLIPNTVVTAEGWISQYPPLHVLLVSLGLRVGAGWLVGPILVAVTVALTCRIAELALKERPATARAGAILAALSPFVLFLGAGYLSHTSAVAFGALALYAALKALESPRPVWPAVTGLAAGGAVAARPWTGLFLAVALPAGIWASRWLRERDGGAGRRERGRRLASRLGWATAGGVPVALALALYNFRFFGHPLRFGYTAAYGDAHLPGFHRDPWGHLYGLPEAVGYTSADLVALGAHLLETPLPAVGLVGAALLLSSRVPRGTGVLLGWALLPVLANALYWHHGQHLGPRMLYEAAPAWALLVAVSAVSLVQRGGGEGDGDGERLARPREGVLPGDRSDPSSSGRSGALELRLRDGLLVALLLCLPAMALLGAQRGLSYRWPADTLARITPPEPPRAPGTAAGGPALVFVHGSWPERVAGRLRAAGMTADSVETALRRNDLCAVDRYAVGRLAGGGPGDTARDAAGNGAPPAAAGGERARVPGGADTAALTFENLPGPAPSLELLRAPGGYAVRRDPAAVWPAECRREAAADRSGVISVAPLLWQGALPGAETDRPLFVRDLGPEENRKVTARYADRRPFLWMPERPDGPPVLLPYEEAITSLWPDVVPRRDP